MRTFSKASLAVAFLATFCLGACGSKSEADQALDEMDAIVDKMIVETKDMKRDEILTNPETKEIMAEGEALETRLDTLRPKFTPEQQSRYDAIVQKASDAQAKMPE